jgi:hypothetical protein
VYPPPEVAQNASERTPFNLLFENRKEEKDDAAIPKVEPDIAAIFR